MSLGEAEFPLEGVNAAAYRIPTDAPDADGTIMWTSTTMVVVRAHTGDQVGTGWTYGAAACRPLIDDILAPLVKGRDAFDVPAAYDAMCRGARTIGWPGITARAISAVDVAMWDLKARLISPATTTPASPPSSTAGLMSRASPG
jgi:L-alanine-DL-glutamate epimerase-like enolase superfamily enzyme